VRVGLRHGGLKIERRSAANGMKLMSKLRCIVAVFRVAGGARIRCRRGTRRLRTPS
jgi:hypothetical protein